MNAHTKKLGRSALLFLVFSLAACDCGGTPVGKLTVALDADAPTHDVETVHIKIIESGGDCMTDPAMTEATMALEPDYLPEHDDPNGSGGHRHPLGDALFILGPGDWKACAITTFLVWRIWRAR